MATYYIDSTKGKATNNGLTETSPNNSYRNIDIKPGDTILFKAGSIFRDRLYSPNGEEGKPITWDMYGIGKKPEFWGSVDVTDASKWVEEEKNIWKYIDSESFFNEPCNLIFNDNDCGVLAWEYKDLDSQGKWFYTHLGYDRYDRKMPDHLKDKPKFLYLYSEKNPAEYYGHIECALYYERIMMMASEYVSINNICVKYGGCHGFATLYGLKNVTLNNCEFRFIGGAVWDEIGRVRFGNGAEIWCRGENFTVENCLFDEIYDSCTTQQGMNDEFGPCKNIIMRNNIFRNYGMAAYELRDRVVINSHFDNNICIGAGLGFSLQGETPPRKSELWPQPMGHHLFLWRIHKSSENGSLTINNNIFHEAPYGAAIYSTIHRDAEKQIHLSGNTYYSSLDEDALLIRMGGNNYSKKTFEQYVEENDNDRGSKLEKIF